MCNKQHVMYEKRKTKKRPENRIGNMGSYLLTTQTLDILSTTYTEISLRGQSPRVHRESPW